MNDEDVLSALKALAQADREVEAPLEVEQRLRVVYRQKYSSMWAAMWGRQSWRRAGFLAGLSFALATALVAMLIYFRPKHEQPAVAKIDPPKIQPAPIIEAPTPAPLKTATRTPRRTQRPREVVTDFFPLVEIAPPLDRAALVRVNLPASAMRAVGLPVREDRLFDRVNADVLLSEEGVATAIRFVKFE